MARVLLRLYFSSRLFNRVLRFCDSAILRFCTLYKRAPLYGQTYVRVPRYMRPPKYAAGGTYNTDSPWVENVETSAWHINSVVVNGRVVPTCPADTVESALELLAAMFTACAEMPVSGGSPHDRMQTLVQKVRMKLGVGVRDFNLRFDGTQHIAQELFREYLRRTGCDAQAEKPAVLTFHGSSEENVHALLENVFDGRGHEHNLYGRPGTGPYQTTSFLDALKYAIVKCSTNPTICINAYVDGNMAVGKAQNLDRYNVVAETADGTEVKQAVHSWTNETGTYRVPRYSGQQKVQGTLTVDPHPLRELTLDQVFVLAKNEELVQQQLGYSREDSHAMQETTMTYFLAQLHTRKLLTLEQYNLLGNTYGFPPPTGQGSRRAAPAPAAGPRALGAQRHHPYSRPPRPLVVSEKVEVYSGRPQLTCQISWTNPDDMLGFLWETSQELREFQGLPVFWVATISVPELPAGTYAGGKSYARQAAHTLAYVQPVHTTSAQKIGISKLSGPIHPELHAFRALRDLPSHLGEFDFDRAS